MIRKVFCTGLSVIIFQVSSVQAPWTEGHKAERAFNRGKEFDRLVDNVLSGSVDPATLSRDVLELVVREAQRRQARRGKLKRKTFKKSKALAPSHCNVFVERDVQSAMGDFVLQQATTTLPCTLADRQTAKIFVMSDPLQLSQRTSWAVGLCGGLACDSAYLCSNGAQGIAVQYRAFGRSRRTVHLSDGFKDAFPALLPIIQACAANWNLVDAATLTRLKRICTGARRSELLVMVSSAEWPAVSRPPLLQIMKYVFNEQLARQFILQPLPLVSQTGTCDNVK